MKNIFELEGVEDFETHVEELEDGVIPNKMIKRLIHYTREQGWTGDQIIDLLLYLTEE